MNIQMVQGLDSRCLHDGWMNVQMVGCLDSRFLNELMDEYIDDWMSGW